MFISLHNNAIVNSSILCTKRLHQLFSLKSLIATRTKDILNLSVEPISVTVLYEVTVWPSSSQHTTHTTWWITKSQGRRHSSTHRLRSTLFFAHHGQRSLMLCYHCYIHLLILFWAFILYSACVKLPKINHVDEAQRNNQQHITLPSLKHTVSTVQLGLTEV